MPHRAVTTPEEFFGFQLGADRKLARWDKIVEYFNQLQTESDRLRVVNMGESTEGYPFLLAIISSPDNLDNLEHIRQISLQLSDPRGLTTEQADSLVGQGKAIICQSGSMHATEVGGTQMLPELAYDLLSDDSEDTLRILDNVVFLMVPCFNPDGQVMITDWYNRWVGTEYEGCALPWLYHKYTGHDNNRDGFMLNIVESQYMARILFREWRPQAYLDHHHMGSYGARLWVEPHCDPIHPYGNPLVWRELSWYGSHMAYKLEEAGKSGVLNAAQWPNWGNLGFHWITNFHNIAGLLTESASAKLATPLYIDASQLEGLDDKTFPEYEAQTNFPNPWPGGWWHLRDIVEQKKIAAWALLDLAARHKETVLWNAYRKAQRQIRRGQEEDPQAFVIPAEQHDPLTALKLVRVLLAQGIEVHQARSALAVGDREFPAGTHVVFMQQPKWGLIKTLLERTLHSDGYWDRTPEGAPRVGDTATDTVAEFMGVRVIPARTGLRGSLAVVNEAGAPAVTVPQAEGGYVLPANLNDTYTVVQRLLRAGVQLRRWQDPVEVRGEELAAGAFLVPADASEALSGAVEGLGVEPVCLNEKPAELPDEIQPLRVGIYQRYWGGNMREGWTRLVLDKFEHPYVTLTDEDFDGELRDKVDVILLPSDSAQLIIGPDKVDPGKYSHVKRLPHGLGAVESVPPGYRSGIGKQGVEALKSFVQNGGRLVALDKASDFVMDSFEVRVANRVAGLDSTEYLSHGSTLRVEVDTGNPVALGMPEEALVLSWDSPVFELRDTCHAERYHVVARYPERDILQSGWLIGEDRLAGQPALLQVEWGRGELVLFGFSPQFRGQLHGTFKFLFNCLF